MSDNWSTEFRMERLAKHHRRRQFRSGEPHVDDWIATKALQHQLKRLSVTKVLIDAHETIAGYYTLTTGQADFTDLPLDLVKRLPRRQLPVVFLAWFGIDDSHQGQGLGRRLLSQALLDCYLAGQMIPFVAVILDCITDEANSFYRKFGFDELPGQPRRLFLSAEKLQEMMENSSS